MAMSYSNATILGHSYWEQFNEQRNNRRLSPRFENSRQRFCRYFLVNPNKRNGNLNIHYEARIRINPPQISMRLILKTADNVKEIFDLIAQEKNRIDGEISYPLLWKRDAGAKESHVIAQRDDMDPRNTADWNRQHDWLSEVIRDFDKSLRPLIATKSARDL
jgi:hypothetical protein